MVNELTILIEKLKAKQGDLSDEKFAKERGWSRSLWVLIKNNKHTRPGSKFFTAILNHDSEFTLEAIAAQKSIKR